MSHTITDAELAGYVDGCANIVDNNPYIPSDEWNHDGTLFSAYNRGWERGQDHANGTGECNNFKPTVGTPVWVNVTIADDPLNIEHNGWALVSNIVDDTYTVAFPFGNNIVQTTTKVVHERRPPVTPMEVTLVDDDGKNVIVGYGEYPDYLDSTSFTKMIYFTSDKEDITIPLANVDRLVDAIVKVANR